MGGGEMGRAFWGPNALGILLELTCWHVPNYYLLYLIFGDVVDLGIPAQKLSFSKLHHRRLPRRIYTGINIYCHSCQSKMSHQCSAPNQAPHAMPRLQPQICKYLRRIKCTLCLAIEPYVGIMPIPPISPPPVPLDPP